MKHLTGFEIKRPHYQGEGRLDLHASLAYGLVVVIVETHVFTARILDLISDEQYRLLQAELVRRPDVGRAIRGTGGLRKVRWLAGGRGKRGGIRVIYYWHAAREHLLMLLAYPKNEQDDLTPRQRAALRKIIESEYP